tara:strand:+ start:1012 stop:1365 length:354 start_codon:yes stop_codon:yes gene_type:complete
MKYFAMTLNLKNDEKLISEYKSFHRNVWPEVFEALKNIGIIDMKIFLSGTKLFMYIETIDTFCPEVNFQEYTATSQKANEWDELMRNFQTRVPEAKEGEWWSSMEEVFNLKWGENAS